MSKVKFPCPTCGKMIELSRLFGSLSELTVCPICKTSIDVAKETAKRDESQKGVVSVIKYEGDNDTFIWKHPIEDFNFGSMLIVHESQEAIFFRDGQALDTFGAGRHTLESHNLPLLRNLLAIPTNAESVFHSEVYFVNKTVQMAVKWGTSDKVRYIDPLTGTPLEIGASGEMNLMVSDSRRLLLKLVGTMNGISWSNEGDGFTKSLQKAFRPLISNAVKNTLYSIIKQNEIDIFEIDEQLEVISEQLKSKISPSFEEYGLTIPQLYITSIILPEDDPNFKAIRDLHTITLQQKMIQAQASLKISEAKSEMLYRSEQERSRSAIESVHREAELQRQQTETEIAKREAERRIIEAQANAQTLRLQGLAEADIMRAKGYDQKDVLQAEIQKAYAEGIGNMTINGSGGGAVGDMLGIGIGLSAAANVAPQIKSIFGNMSSNQAESLSSDRTWQCSCGNHATGVFCNQCGNKRMELYETWDCSCGKTGVTGNFCNECGARRPETKSGWNCSCGNTDISGNYCSNCGKKRGE